MNEMNIHDEIGDWSAAALCDALTPEESTIDEVIRRSGLPSSAVSVALLGLEMKRLVKQLPGKLFVKNR